LGRRNGARVFCAKQQKSKSLVWRIGYSFKIEGGWLTRKKFADKKKDPDYHTEGAISERKRSFLGGGKSKKGRGTCKNPGTRASRENSLMEKKKTSKEEKVNPEEGKRGGS